MKNILLFFYFFCGLISCRQINNDKLFCQGDCPNNQVCKLGVCQCPENSVLINNYCYGISKGLDKNPLGGIYVPIDSQGCIPYPVFYEFDFDKYNVIYRDTSNITPIAEDLFYNSPLGSKGGFNVSSGSAFKGNDSLIRFYAFQDNFAYPCNCTTGNNMQLMGVFNKACDSLTMNYYFSCCNGAQKDTCVQKFYMP
jgi:hypothetical protein